MATNPNEIDGVLRGGNGKIDAGNIKDDQEATEQYFNGRDRFIFGPPAAEAEPLTGKDLERSAAEAAESAAGGDQWSPGGIKLFSNNAYERLAEMMNCA